MVQRVRQITDSNTIIYKLQYNPKKNKNITKIEISAKGEISHMVGNSGLACLFSAIFFNPQNIYLVGFDGPTISSNEITHFDKKKGKVSYQKIKKIRKFHKTLISYLVSKNIKISSFKDDNFWGITRSDLSIKIY